MSHQKKKFYVVVGLGKTGLTCVRHFVDQGFEVAVTDDRSIPPGLHELRMRYPQVPVTVGQFSEKMLSKADVLVVSPGISIAHPLIRAQEKRGAEIIGDIELFCLEAKAPIIGITGSNGKSTVTTLVGEMAEASGLKVAVGGNLGKPVLDLLSDEVELYVLELSSFQLETTHSLGAKSATILNISPDHLDRYDSFEDYLAAKQKIFTMCEVPVFNRDDPKSIENIDLSSNAVSFGVDVPSEGHFGLTEKEEEVYFSFGSQCLLSVDDVNLKGEYQWANILSSFALGYAAGLPFEGMIAAAKVFSGLPHRCEWIGTYNGVDWYNDSKATNVGAAVAAIEGLGKVAKGKLLLIAGGVGKQADFSDLRPAVAEYAKAVFLMGKDAQDLRVCLEGATELHSVQDFYEAVNLASKHAQPGDIVILSPACASFDMFESFEKRGESFVKVVRALYE